MNRPHTQSVKTGTGFDLEQTLEFIGQWLPTQGPIKDFIHHNTLHAFQDRPFHEAVNVASRLYGARGYMEKRWYQDAFADGRITESALQRVLDSYVASASERAEVRRRLLEHNVDSNPPRAWKGIRDRWLERGVALNTHVPPTLFRYASNYLDQGVAIWRMPHATDTFWNAMGRIVRESYLPIPPLSDPFCRELLNGTPENAILVCLRKLVGNEAFFETYLLEMLLSHPGWSGMFHFIQNKPVSLLSRRSARLLDFAAIELVLELGWVMRREGKDFKPLAEATDVPERLPVRSSAAFDAATYHQLLWHEAFEWSYYENLLGGLEAQAKAPPPASRIPPEVQAFFCIDDRECSLRRHLEEVEPRYATYSTAGFFGVDFFYQGFDEKHPTQFCPVVLTPKHIVHELPLAGGVARSRILQVSPTSHTLFRGWFLTQVLGFRTALRLFLHVFKPSKHQVTEPSLSHITRGAKMKLLREGDERSSEGYAIGYSISEMVDRVYGVLRSTGLTVRFSRLIVFIAHGSSSANNPHFAAYDCGACSGRPGAPNSRAFAWMANHPEVRAGLRAKGLDLADDCHFVAGLHDTSRDEIHFFDVEEVPFTFRPQLALFHKAMQEALQRNAKERCRRFDLAGKNLSPEGALAHVQERASAIFEPRPEYNHATNTAAIVGRRNGTRGLFLDRRVFLNSYDPSSDPKGDLLSGILNAVIPVCGGISLEYFFSRVDNEVYGAGTKLPHNVVGLIGVANGVEGDLRNGLPAQMVEIHDPIRLLVVVEQNPEVALSAVKRNPTVFEWVEKDWVRYACIDPAHGDIHFYSRGEFVRSKFTQGPLPEAENSLAVVEGRRENIPVYRVKAGGE